MSERHTGLNRAPERAKNQYCPPKVFHNRIAGLALLFVCTCMSVSCGSDVWINVEQGDHGEVHLAAACYDEFVVDWGDGAKTKEEGRGIGPHHIYAYNGFYKISVTCTGEKDHSFPFAPSGSIKTGITTARDQPPSITPFVAALAALITAVAGLIAVLRRSKSRSHEGAD